MREKAPRDICTDVQKRKHSDAPALRSATARNEARARRRPRRDKPFPALAGGHSVLVVTSRSAPIEKLIMTATQPRRDRERLPERQQSVTFGVERAGLAHTATVSWFREGRLAELFLTKSHRRLPWPVR
jgi:hypothetical protein